MTRTLNHLKIYSVDAATITSGYALLNITENGTNLIAAGAYKAKSADPTTVRLALLQELVYKDIELHKPDVLVVEKIMFTGGNKFLMSLGTTCRAVGAVEACFGRYPELDYRTYTATQARSLCKAPKEKGRKKKSDLRIFLNKYFESDLKALGYPEGLKSSQEDISDAIGLALYTYTQIAAELRKNQ